MDTSTLLKYLLCKASAKETQQVQAWLSDDSDGSHAEQYREVRAIFEGITLFSEEPDRARPSARKAFPFLRFAAVAAAAIAVVVGSVQWAQLRTREKMSLRTETINVPAGQTMQLSLEDGTELWMNSVTQVEKPVVFSRHHRTLSLNNGEILLDVARDESRPFHIKTPQTDIEVLGTRFDVSVGNGMTSAALIRGSIRIHSENGSTAVLKPYEKAVLDEAGNISISRFDNAGAIESWTTGIIDLVGVPFEELMKKFEKAFDTTIILSCKEIPQIHLARGKVRVIDGVEHALDVLKRGAEFRYTIDYSNNVITIL